MADAMKKADPGSASENNTKVPAGFTYLGQFVDHHIALDLDIVRRQGGRSDRNRKLPDAIVRSRQCGWPWPRRSSLLVARNAGDADGNKPCPLFHIGKTVPGGPAGLTDVSEMIFRAALKPSR